MLHTILLALHSLLRWLVLISLIYTIFRAYKGWFSNLPFTPRDNTLRHVTATILHVQFLAGIILYAVSPVTRNLFQNFGEAVEKSSVRFFGLEHSIMMLIAVAVVSIGSAKAKRETDDTKKFKIMAIWFTIGLLIILVSIPWPFSPIASRPWFRLF